MATKQRINIDGFIIAAFMIIVGILVMKFPGIYLEGKHARDLFDIIGFTAVIVGVLLRMSARGYKKFSSQQSNQLVTEGPYKLVRNPMYLGTFLIGIGFVFPLFPIWTIAIFAVVFYLRFIVQIRKEETWLSQSFGQVYEDYCRRVPRFIPTPGSIAHSRFSGVFPWKHLWTTKEKYGLVCWPALNVTIELLQEHILWGKMDLLPIVTNTAIVAVIAVWMFHYILNEDGYVL